MAEELHKEFSFPEVFWEVNKDCLPINDCYEYQFPAIADYSFDELQALKIAEETGEFIADVSKCRNYNAIIECFDIIQAAETYLRNQDQQLVNMAYEYVIRKNDKRGYYGKGGQR